MLVIGDCVAVEREDGGWESPCFVEAVSEDGTKFTTSIFNVGQIEVDIADTFEVATGEPRGVTSVERRMGASGTGEQRMLFVVLGRCYYQNS